MISKLALRLSTISAVVVALPAASGAQSSNLTASAALAAAGGGGGTVVVDPSTTYYACYVPGSGTVYRIKTADTPAACTKSTHVQFSWSPPVKAGFSEVAYGWEARLLDVNESGQIYAYCPEGTKLVGGGYEMEFNTSITRPVVMRSGPSYSMSGQAWVVTVDNKPAPGQPGGINQVQAFATCLK